jgi:hypothetical protein
MLGCEGVELEGLNNGKRIGRAQKKEKEKYELRRQTDISFN